MNRRAFLASLAAAFALDPERALWTPGKRMISIPRANEPHLWMDVQNDAPVIVTISPDNQPTRCYVVEPSAFRRQVSFPVSGTAPQITVVGRSPAKAHFYGIEVDRVKEAGWSFHSVTLEGWPLWEARVNIKP